MTVLFKVLLFFEREREKVRERDPVIMGREREMPFFCVSPFRVSKKKTKRRRRRQRRRQRRRKEPPPQKNTTFFYVVLLSQRVVFYPRFAVVVVVFVGDKKALLFSVGVSVVGVRSSSVFVWRRRWRRARAVSTRKNTCTRLVFSNRRRRRRHHHQIVHATYMSS